MENGYFSGENLETLEHSGVDVYIATGRDDKKHSESLKESERNLVKSDFHYDEEEDCFYCPNDQTLPLKNKGTRGKERARNNLSN